MSADLYTNQDSNVRKTWVLMGLFLVFIMGIGWFLSYLYNDQSILYIAVIFSLLMNIFSYWHSDKIVLKMSGAKPVKREEYFDLYNAVENLSITAGLPMPKVYVIQDDAPNAFATGRNKNHSAVVVTSGLLTLLNKNELEGVIAHELAHIGNRDILLQTIVVTLVGVLTLLSDWMVRGALRGKKGGDSNGGKFEIILLIVGVVLVILSPLIGKLIQLAISRKREFLADSTGAMLTRYPEGLASALEKISGYDGQIKKANHATAHLYISNPFKNNKNGKVGFMKKAFMTHPPIPERTSALRGTINSEVIA